MKTLHDVVNEILVESKKREKERIRSASLDDLNAELRRLGEIRLDEAEPEGHVPFAFVAWDRGCGSTEARPAYTREATPIR